MALKSTLQVPRADPGTLYRQLPRASSNLCSLAALAALGVLAVPVSPVTPYATVAGRKEPR